MQGYTTVTQKGQVTIPKEIRDFLHIKNLSKVKIYIDKETKRAIIEPTNNLFDMQGYLTDKIKKNKNKSPLEAREYIDKNYKR
jgi:antitoxin PrlF